MSQKLYIGDLIFENDFVYALTGNQEKIKFSKHERALLGHFIARPGKLLSREMLLDAVQTSGSDSLDRNIDYLVSRLRRKLNDSAHNPKYIATQYGEGYMWVAERRSGPSDMSNEVYLSVGPVYGLEKASQVTADAKSFALDLVTALQEQLGKHRRIELLTRHETEDSPHHFGSRYAVELSFLTLADSLTCSLVALNRKTGQIFGTFRHLFPNGHFREQSLQSIAQLAKNIKDKLWDDTIFRTHEQPTLTTDPLSVGIYKATQLFEPENDNFREVETRLRNRLMKNPEDHHAGILLATHLHNQIYFANFDQLDEREKEIGLLVFDHLTSIQHDALYLSAAAERLDDLGYHELSENLAERALDLGPSFAACYMVIGRIRVHRGLIHEGLAYYEHSLEMSEKDSVFYHLLMTRKCIAHKALGEQNKVRELAEYLVEQETRPLMKIALKLYFLADDPQALGSEISKIAASITQEIANRYLKLLYFGAARLFSEERHRENLLRGPVNFLLQLHGQDIIPEVIKQCAPRLFSRPLKTSTL